MPTEDQIMELTVEKLLQRHGKHLEAAGHRAYSAAKPQGYDLDWVRDEMIDRIESYMFSDFDWEIVPATVVSDVAHEIADKVLEERGAY